MNDRSRYIYELLIAAWESYVRATGRRDFSEFIMFLKRAVDSSESE